MSKRKKPLSTIQKIILGVIGVAFIAVVIAALSVILNRPENVITSKIESLSSDYYENYLYQEIINSDQFSGNIDETLQKYIEVGFSPITLRELLLHDTEKTKDIAPLIKEHCDENRTIIKFFPEAPFSKTSYRVNYSYSCDF